MDQNQLDSLYQQYLGRGVDASGASTWGGADYNTVVQGILGSQEYQNRQQQQAQPQQQQQQQQPQPQQQQQGGGGTDINSIYKQYLNRDVDQSGAATYANWNPQDIINAVKNSAEYRSLNTGGGTSNQYSGGNPQDLANQVFSSYKTNQNYDQALNDLNAAPQNADYYRARLGLIGNMMGWQTGQNTGDRNSVYQKELESYLPGAKAAGLSDSEINNLINKNSASASQQNQQRIAEEGAKGQGWVNQNIPGGWTTVGALAAAAAAPYALGALSSAAGAGGALTTTELLAGAGGAFVPVEGASFALPGLAEFGAGAIGQSLPYTSAYDAANLFANGITDAGQLADVLTATGIDSFVAADMGNLAAQGLSAEQIAQVMGSSYTAAELAGTGIESLIESAAGASTLSNLLKGAKNLLDPKTALGKTLIGTLTGSGNNNLASALRGSPSSGASGGLDSAFALARGNQSPFNFGTQSPVWTSPTSKSDPFAALNVQQTTSQQQYNPLTALLKEGIYRG